MTLPRLFGRRTCNPGPQSKIVTVRLHLAASRPLSLQCRPTRSCSKAIGRQRSLLTEWAKSCLRVFAPRRQERARQRCLGPSSPSAAARRTQRPRRTDTSSSTAASRQVLTFGLFAGCPCSCPLTRWQSPRPGPAALQKPQHSWRGAHKLVLTACDACKVVQAALAHPAAPALDNTYMTGSAHFCVVNKTCQLGIFGLCAAVMAGGGAVLRGLTGGAAGQRR